MWVGLPRRPTTFYLTGFEVRSQLVIGWDQLIILSRDFEWASEREREREKERDRLLIATHQSTAKFIKTVTLQKRSFPSATAPGAMSTTLKYPILASSSPIMKAGVVSRPSVTGLYELLSLALDLWERLALMLEAENLCLFLHSSVIFRRQSVKRNNELNEWINEQQRASLFQRVFCISLFGLLVLFPRTRCQSPQQPCDQVGAEEGAQGGDRARRGGGAQADKNEASAILFTE